MARLTNTAKQWEETRTAFASDPWKIDWQELLLSWSQTVSSFVTPQNKTYMVLQRRGFVGG